VSVTPGRQILFSIWCLEGLAKPKEVRARREPELDR